MNWVTEYCNRAILIERGEMIMEGEPAEVVELHQVHTEEARARTTEAAQTAGVDPRIAPSPLRVRPARRDRVGDSRDQRRRRSAAAAKTAITTPTTPATARAPRQSTSGLISPSTRRAMTTPAKF